MKLRFREFNTQKIFETNQIQEIHLCFIYEIDYDHGHIHEINQIHEQSIS